MSAPAPGGPGAPPGPPPGPPPAAPGGAPDPAFRAQLFGMQNPLAALAARYTGGGNGQQ